MKKITIIFYFLFQVDLMAQELYTPPIILFKSDSVRVERQNWKNGSDYYQKATVYKLNNLEEIFCLGADTSNLSIRGFLDNPRGTSEISKKIWNMNPSGVFYNDSIFSFGALGVKHRSSIVALAKYKKQNGVWKLNKVVELPITLSFTNHCGVFFLSEDIAYVDIWHRKGQMDNSEKNEEIYSSYFVILGENNTYTKFVQEGKEYPPERPLYITPPNGNPTISPKEK